MHQHHKNRLKFVGYVILVMILSWIVGNIASHFITLNMIDK